MRRFFRSTVIGVAAWCVRLFWLMSHKNEFVDPHFRQRKPRMYVDLSVILRHDAQTGIQRVVRAIWAGLARHSQSEFDLVPVSASLWRGYCVEENSLGVGRRQSVLRGGDVVSMGPADVFFGLDLTANILPHHLAQIRKWRTGHAKVSFLIYDLLPLMRPEFFERRSVRIFRRWFDAVSRQSNQLLCISEPVADEVRAMLRHLDASGIPEVVTITLGADIGSTLPTEGVPADAQTLLAHLKTAQSVLMVGTVEPRKGYEVALAAFERLWLSQGEAAPTLIIVGRPGWRTEWLQSSLRRHPERGRRLFWIEDASDEYLEILYQASTGVLVTSHAEGFGLPLREAVLKGKPTLARNLRVFHDICLHNVEYFDDDAPVALADRIGSWLRAGVKAAHGAEASSPPSWESSVNLLLSLLATAPPLLSRGESDVA